MKLLFITIHAVAVAGNLKNAYVRGKTARHNDHVRTHQKVRNNEKKLGFQSRIVGGTVASQGEFPFNVLWDGCGASLIHDDIILSAAHCNVIPTKAVLVGAFKHQSTQGGAIFRSITSRRVHPKYDTFSSTYNYDYLVMKLNKPVVTLSPVMLNPNASNPANNEVLTTIGFGVTTDGGLTEPKKLRKVNVTYVDPTKCSKDYSEVINGKLELCAGSAGKDTCQGDSGGIILDSNGVQVGIVSWGRGCGRPGFPGIYSRISGAIDWINQQVCDMSDNPPSSCKGGNSAQSTSLSPSPTPYIVSLYPTVGSSSPGASPLSTAPSGGSNFGGTPLPSTTLTPSYNSRSSTYAPTVTPRPTYRTNGASPTLALTPAPLVTASTSLPTASSAPSAPSFHSFTYAPTTSLAPAPSFSQYTLSPTAALEPAAGIPSYTLSPTSSNQISPASFSVDTLRVACETFLCPYDHQKVQYCHIQSDGSTKAYCVTADIAFMFLTDNAGDYCGPCASI